MASSEPAVRAVLSSICRQCSRPTVQRPHIRAAAAATAAAARRLPSSRAGSSWMRATAVAATKSATPGDSATVAAGDAAPVGASTSSPTAKLLQPRWMKDEGTRRAAIPAQRRNSSTAASATAAAAAEADTATPKSKPKPQRVLGADDLFHSFTNSPIADMRRRAAFIKMHARCPHPHHKHSGGADGGLAATAETTKTAAGAAGAAGANSDGPQLKALSRLEGGELAPAHVDFECPDCGVPVYCSEEHWMDDYEAHLQICDTLRQINEDDHDLRSGREFPEFDYPGEQMAEALINMTNWDTFMYTRGFSAVNDDRSMRQVTRLLTYPVTVASVLHELSPYNIRRGGQLTAEGLKSFSALRYTLHPPLAGETDSVAGIRPQAPAVRLFVLGARAESSLPRDVWVQLAHLFPRARIHVILIGPESMTNRDDEFPLPPRTPENPFGALVEDRIWATMKISTIVDYFHNIHRTGYFYPYDPYFDCFMLFHPGLGHPSSSHEWTETVPMLLETKAPVIVTGYTQYDMERDIAWVNKTAGGEFDLLMEPGENIFRSLRWDLNDLDPQDVSCGNWGLWAFRGKRYEATHKPSE